MAKILTVDDSRAVRLIVAKHLREIGFEVDEAEDGEQGLAKLEEDQYAMVILDITMPVLDGQGMLAKMRERGNNTPVLMLSSESKRSIIAQLMRLGIADYILKPFMPEELQSKVLKALKMEAPTAAGAARAAGPAPMDAAGGGDRPGGASAGASAAAGARAAEGGGAKAAVDILVIDDMENVQKRLRQLIPEQLTLASALNAPAALATARDKTFRVVLIDYDLPEVSSSSLMKQLRLLLPQATYLAMALRTTPNVQEAARDAGFEGVLFKPFNAEGLEDSLLKYFDNQDIVARDENVLRVALFKGREARLGGYFVQISSKVAKAIEDLAAACFGEMILDLSQLPSAPEKVARLVLEIRERSNKLGVELRLVGTPDLQKMLKQLSDTASVPVFATVKEALAGKAAA
jgi:two-component system, cell cycle response regulator